MAKVSLKAKREMFIVSLTQKSKFAANAADRYRSIRQNMNDKKRARKSEKAKRDMFWTERRDCFSDLYYFEHIRPLLDAMPQSNGCRYYEPYDAQVGIICDEFLYDSLKSSANLIPVTPDNYKETCPKLDMLLVVSAWRGVGGEWFGLGNADNPLRETMNDVIAAAKAAKIPVIFYSKEDPPNYDVFIDIAKKCDFVFTSCAEVVEKYKADCGHDRVEVLCFSINPQYHNPIGLRRYPKDNAVIFSGTWMTKYPERLKDMKVMFDGVLKAGYRFKILDRCYGRENPRYMFPEEYWRYVSPEVTHDYLQKIHKMYDWAININTIKDSSTMFANRAYELQANGNLMISNHSIGVERLFPDIYIIDKEQDVVDALTSMSPEQVYQKQMAGVRRVMTDETGYDRMGEILRAAGIKARQPERNVLIIADDVAALESTARSQSYSKGKVDIISESELDDNVLSGYDIAVFWSKENSYGRYYLEDMINAFKYTACDYITKDAYFDNSGLLHEGKEHDYVDIIKDKYRTAFWVRSFSAEELKGLNGITEHKNGYSIDRFEMNNR